MAARTKARKRALDVLYEADMREVAAPEVMEQLGGRLEHPLNPYTIEIVNGVTAHRDRIDDLISTYSSGWTLDCMPAVDRNLLRVGTWELLWSDDVPDGVVISEAVELAANLSTDESSKFVNGLLSKLIEVRPHLVLTD